MKSLERQQYILYLPMNRIHFNLKYKLWTLSHRFFTKYNDFKPFVVPKWRSTSKIMYPNALKSIEYQYKISNWNWFKSFKIQMVDLEPSTLTNYNDFTPSVGPKWRSRGQVRYPDALKLSEKQQWIFNQPLKWIKII